MVASTSASPIPGVKAVGAFSPAAARTVNRRPDPGMASVLRPRTSDAAFQAGATVLVYANYSGFASKTGAVLDRLAGLGINSVGMAFPVFQDNWRSNVVHIDQAKTPSMDNLALFVGQAHRRGFTVMLRPLLDEQSLHPDGKWRGVISPSDPNQWFATYGAVLQQYAVFARANRIEVLDIGTELESMQPDAAHWRGIIASVRQLYSGQLTYSANWSQPSTGFGSALDFIGIDAFFPLDAPSNATVAQLTQAWQPWLPKIQDLGRVVGKPVLVTELGTTPEKNSYQQPWLWSHGTGPNVDDQANYYAASCQALKSQVSGMYWWDFELDPKTAADPYSPEGKPAERQIAACFH